jgi:hypothetical protein
VRNNLLVDGILLQEALNVLQIDVNAVHVGAFTLRLYWEIKKEILLSSSLGVNEISKALWTLED